MSTDKIDKLYQNYEILNDATDKKKHESEYRDILNSVKGSDKEKKLAAQFIPKFFKYFPSLTDIAIDLQLDLCEDNDIQIRRMAIKELPAFCKDFKENTPRISDILAQLLNASDPTELQQVNSSLQMLSKLDAMGTIKGLFHQITQGDESVRLKCLQYINSKFVKGGAEVFTKETEDLIITETKKLLQDVSADEFQQCIQILSQTKLGKTVTGQQELVKLCMEQADIEADLDTDHPSDDDVYTFLTCANQALPFCSSQIETTPFVKYFCRKFLPLENWHLIGAADDQTQIQLRLLKVFAEICTYCGSLDNPKEKIEALLNVLLEFLPLPPADLDESDTPSILFSHVECLMYALHALGKQCPEYLGFPNDESKLKDFRSRLQYLARNTQGYVKKLQDDVKGKLSATSDPKTDEEKLKIMGLKTTSNIQALIRDLYHPSYKSVIHLSWVTEKSKLTNKVTVAKNGTESNETEAPKKRHAPITFVSDSPKPPKQAKNNAAQKVYSPPSGKYSRNMNMSGGSGFGNRNNRNNRFRNDGNKRGGFRGKNYGRY